MTAAILVVLAFHAALFFGGILLPGLHVDGQPLADGTRRRYKLSGAVLFGATHVVLLAGWLAFGLSLAPLLDLFWPLFWATNVLAIAVGVLLYVQGTRRGAPRDLGHFLMGPELNPTWLGVDLKMFAYQPSLIGLWCLVLAFGYAQWERHGVLTGRMFLFQAFWWVYLVTHYQREAFMLQTWDVIAEHFGLALAWGDLVLVPFFYCIAGWALVDDLRPLSTANAAALVGFYAFALWLFRGANDQKNRFKADRRAHIWGRPAEALENRILVSGWWGLGRHLNYTGEILVYLAIAMTTGAQSIGPYLLPLWLTGLLAHRALRDERRCRAKYGALWDAYCARVPFRMMPWVY
jgi:delta14-sterol reductase